MTDPIEFPGLDGFLGTRASFMLDFVVVAMVLILVIMGWSIHQVRNRKSYELHKWTQLALAIILLIAVVAFEVDMRIYGWKSRAAGEIGGQPSSMVWNALYVHLVFAVSSTLLWPVVIIRAWRQFPSPPTPSVHSRSHIFWARLAAADMLLTSITGWIFYLLAFV